MAIGQKASTVASIVEVLEEHGAMEYTTWSSATASEPAPLQYVAPYSGYAMAEDHGRARRVSSFTTTFPSTPWRTVQLSLLLRRPPGREAYPGDVFYCTAACLERAAKTERRARRRLD